MDAWVEGKEYAIPTDLYIPPDALKVILETTFEGPLDLLLYLIRRHNLDIISINVANITHQYIVYIELMEAHQFELAGEYLVMAATLAEIKSRSLLPRTQLLDDEEEDPRVRLIKQLQEYERFKTASERVADLPRMGRDNFPVTMAMPDVKQVRPQPTVAMEDLLVAYKDVLKRCDMYEHHTISRERLSTRERMSRVMLQLQEHQFMAFHALFDVSEGRMGVVVTFLAMMELVKEKLVKLVQAQEFGPIHVSLGGQHESPNQELAL
ncbi:MAG: segregation/condensation protein A [Oceanospirillaceae bacterium]|jgi:segregation and condensation protein A|nr:segregation/condensation protein A [Oceanospirillaceae bacterium]MBT4442880.1 segregation/condensation protein A [Oceanospirillaceae bacterium]MBT6076972.1 segregation/condensation protein A [Oceanospirillaceae bacterium]